MTLTWRYVVAFSRGADEDVGVERGIEPLVCTVGLTENSITVYWVIVQPEFSFVGKHHNKFMHRYRRRAINYEYATNSHEEKN